MLDDEDKRRAGQVVGSVLNRQAQLGTGEDPFALMKQLTETFKQPSGPMNSTWAPGGYSSVGKKTTTTVGGMNMSSYAAF